MIRILVVSDRPVVRAGLERILEASDDCQVVGGATLDEVISQVAGRRPDVVLLDLSDDGLDSAESFWQLATEMPEAGQPTRNGDELQGVLGADRVGAPTTLKLIRGGELRELTVTVGEQG